MTLESVSDEIFLMIHRHIIKYSLDCVRSLFVAADRNKVPLNELQDSQPLLHRAVRKQLLEEVVTVLVYHDCGEFVADFMQQEFY